VVRRVAASDGFSRFELAEDITEHHHHLVCTRCGKMIDATPTAAFAEAIRRYLRPGGHRGRTGACSGPLRPALARLGPGGSGLLLLGD
jgi:hypothetical protein